MEKDGQNGEEGEESSFELHCRCWCWNFMMFRKVLKTCFLLMLFMLREGERGGMAVNMILYSFERVANNGLNMLEGFHSKKGGRVAPASPENKELGDVRIVLDAANC